LGRSDSVKDRAGPVRRTQARRIPSRTAASCPGVGRGVGWALQAHAASRHVAVEVQGGVAGNAALVLQEVEPHSTRRARRARAVGRAAGPGRAEPCVCKGLFTLLRCWLATVAQPVGKTASPRPCQPMPRAAPQPVALAYGTSPAGHCWHALPPVTLLKNPAVALQATQLWLLCRLIPTLPGGQGEHVRLAEPPDPAGQNAATAGLAGGELGLISGA
jgi:hypothetical protein